LHIIFSQESDKGSVYRLNSLKIKKIQAIQTPKHKKEPETKQKLCG